MPTYTYRCPAGHERQVVHGMTEDPAVECDYDTGEEGHCCGQWCCGPPSCTCGPCGAAMSRVILRAPVALLSAREAPTQLTRTRGLDKADGYQAHLARFPNDPQAYTSGKNAKDRLIDQRLREGWVEVPRPRDQELTGKPKGMKSAAERAAQKVKEGKVDLGS